MGKKPKKKPAQDEGNVGAIDWTAIKLDYVTRLRKISYEELARKWGVNLSNLKRHAANDPEGTWLEQRLTYEQRAAAEATRQAFNNRVEAILGLRVLEYRESTSHLRQMIKIRLERGDAWAPAYHRAHQETVASLFAQARAQLEAPDDEGSGPRSPPLPRFVPRAFLEMELEARELEGDVDPVVGEGEDDEDT